MKESLVLAKSLDFGVRIMRFYRFLMDERKEFIVSKQICRSGTSIGANISEALSAESDLDFIHKLSISQKEINETKYWLMLLLRSEIITKPMYDSLLNDCEQLRKMIASIILTKKNNMANKKTHNS